MSAEKDFLQSLLSDIEHDRLVLPTLPEVALQIREAVEDPNVSAGRLAEVIGSDAALSARIIRVANSALLRGTVKVENLQMAVMRLGITFVRNLATGLAMEQMFQATSDVVDERLREVWQHSAEVASICTVLARHYTRLSADQAMLAGLVHSIGVLPILTAAEDHPAMLHKPRVLDKIIQRLHPKIGYAILKTWDFPPEITEVPASHLKFDREVDTVDYADLVTVANLQALAGSDHPLAQVPWNTVKAFERVGLETDVEVTEIEGLSEEVQQAKEALK